LVGLFADAFGEGRSTADCDFISTC